MPWIEGLQDYACPATCSSAGSTRCCGCLPMVRCGPRPIADGVRSYARVRSRRSGLCPRCFNVAAT